MLEAFESDVVVCDYVVRGYTRDENGKRIYMDHKVQSIQDYIKPKSRMIITVLILLYNQRIFGKQR